MIVSNSLIVFIFLEILVLCSSLVALYFAQNIVRKWDFSSTLPSQYALEKSDYLVSLVLVASLFTKISLLPFFISLLDDLSYKLPGAMCAAGVISANEYGNILLLVKVLVIFISGIWLYLYKQDRLEIDFSFIKKRYYLFIFLSFFMVFEILLEYMFISRLDVNVPVACCSVIFGANSNSLSLPFGLSINSVLILFYLLFFLLTFSFFGKYYRINFIANLFFLILSFYALTYFFSSYVYSLPTHKCPYCLFQKDYYFVGYVFWGSLLLGVFYASCAYIMKLVTKQEFDYMYRLSYIFDTIFTLLCTAYVALYYMINGVWL